MNKARLPADQRYLILSEQWGAGGQWRIIRQEKLRLAQEKILMMGTEVVFAKWQLWYPILIFKVRTISGIS